MAQWRGLEELSPGGARASEFAHVTSSWSASLSYLIRFFRKMNIVPSALFGMDMTPKRQCTLNVAFAYFVIV
jgi:hypothetical protein